MLVVVDIETAAGPLPEGFPENLAPDMALDAHRNIITVIAWNAANGDVGTTDSMEVFNGKIKEWRGVGARFGGHNFKFDLRTLITKGAHMTSADLEEDSMLQARALPDKIPEAWLATYEIQRVEENKKLGSQVHRKSGPHGLKTLAPYVLGVDPFWEAADHADVTYAGKDALYTRMLIEAQQPLLYKSEATKFYQTLLGWSRMFLDAELKGMRIDLELLQQKWEESKATIVQLESSIRDMWKEPIHYLEGITKDKVCAEYDEKLMAQLTKKGKTVGDSPKLVARYEGLKQAALAKIEPFNIQSPSQIQWVLKDYYGLDLSNLEGKPSTDKGVLHRLASTGRKDAEALLEHREHNKLATSFFPTYTALQHNSRLHPSYRIEGARTGRISCSLPNIQQTSKQLRSLFVPPDGRKLLVRDYDNGEPLLVAYLTECPVLCDMMLKGESIHDHNTRTIFELDTPIEQVKLKHKLERNVSKEIGLSILYGAGVWRIKEAAQKHGIMFSELEAKRIHARLKDLYKEVFRYKKELDHRLEMGDTVTNLLGRKFKFEDKDEVYMKGFNQLVQSSLSDLLIQSSYEAQQKSGGALDFLAAIHDETMFEVDEDQAMAMDALLVEEMTKYKLTTAHGTIRLKTSGGICDQWQH